MTGSQEFVGQGRISLTESSIDRSIGLHASPEQYLGRLAAGVAAMPVDAAEIGSTELVVVVLASLLVPVCRVARWPLAVVVGRTGCGAAAVVHPRTLAVADAVPEGAVPEGAVSEGAVPEGAVPEGDGLRSQNGATRCAANP